MVGTEQELRRMMHFKLTFEFDLEENCDMATRADFDAALADLASAIAAAATRFSGGGPVITDQDVAALKKDTADVTALGTSGGGGGNVTFSIDPTTIQASAQATCTLTSTAAAPTSDQVWSVTVFPADAVIAPSTVTWPAGQFFTDFKATASAPVVDTPCTITATFGPQTVSAKCTVVHA